MDHNVPAFNYQLKEGWSDLKVDRILFEKEELVELLDKNREMNYFKPNSSGPQPQNPPQPLPGAEYKLLQNPPQPLPGAEYK